MKCPRCGASRQPEDTECRRCGIDFRYVEKKLAGRPGSGEPNPSASKACPKCGFTNPEDAEECLRCGINFDQYASFLKKRQQVVEEVGSTTDGLIDSELLRAAIAQAQAEEAAAEASPPPEFTRTRCPHCGQRYRIRPNQIGVTTRCRRCSSIFKIEPLPPVR